jgi:hypothetical protein
MRRKNKQGCKQCCCNGSFRRSHSYNIEEVKSDAFVLEPHRRSVIVDCLNMIIFVNIASHHNMISCAYIFRRSRGGCVTVPVRL